MSSHATATIDQPPPLDPARVAERLSAATEVVADALDHMDTVLTAAEAELMIARYHHLHRTAHSPTAG